MDDEPKSPEYSEDEYVDLVNQYLPLSSTTIEPQFFIINKNNTGRQIFSEKQLQNYFRLKQSDEHTEIKVQPGAHSIQNYQIMTQQAAAPRTRPPYSIPRVVNNITQTRLPQTCPPTAHYTYRHFQKFKRFDAEAQTAIHEDLQAIERHREKLVRHRANN